MEELTENKDELITAGDRQQDRKQDPEDSRRHIFEDMPVSQALKAMVVPTIISQIVVLVYNMADTFYVGRTNDPYMVAGVSLILPVFNILICLAGLAGTGGGTLISRLLGEGRQEEARRVSWFSIYISIFISFIYSLIMGIFMEPILLLLGASDSIYEYARQYVFCVIVLGAIPTVLSNVLSNLVRSTGMSKEASFGITLGGVLNIGLDPLFMFVLLPKGYEVLGVGIATFLSNCVACLYFCSVIFRTRRQPQSVITFSPASGRPSKRSIFSIFFVGVPASVSSFLFDMDYVIVDKLMVAYSEVALAAVGIVLKVERLPINVGIGICQGMMPLVAYNYASGDHKRMDDVIKYARRLGLLVAIVSIVGYEIFAPYIVRFFISEPQTAVLATDFLRARIIATPLMFMSFFTVYLFQSFGLGNKSMFLAVMRWAVFNIPMLFILNHFIGMYGIVWSQATADTLTVLLSLYVYGKYKKEHVSLQ